MALKAFFLAMIDFYRKCISPHMEHRCRFVPSCSNYAFEAIAKHGFFKGFILALIRLLKCNPLFKGGYDPVK